MTLRSVGANGGQAAAFTYDLARSVVYTRQGNPAWAGQERDGVTPIRPDDLFFGAKTGDVQPDWVDLNKVAIPQADEQQRLLANLITLMGEDRKPVPRFWYLPRGVKAAVVMTGDDHAQRRDGRPLRQVRRGEPAPAARSPMGVRALHLVHLSRLTAHGRASPDLRRPGLRGRAAHRADRDQRARLRELDGSRAAGVFDTQLPRVAGQVHERSVADHAPDALRLLGRLGHSAEGRARERDPAGHELLLLPGQLDGGEARLHDRLGHADALRRHRRHLIDVYQANTEITDESGQAEPGTINALLDGAVGANGYYGAFVANIHTDSAGSTDSDAIVAAAQSRGVPIVSAKQLLDWTDGREQSTFTAFAWSGTTLEFKVRADSRQTA